MLAVVKNKTEPGIEVIDVNIPRPGPEDVLVRVRAAGICGSDIHIYEWKQTYRWLQLPIIPGHEFAGEICEVGASVNRARIGERVVGDPYIPCGKCWNCKMGLFQLCNRDQIVSGIPAPALQYGFRRDGGMAEYVVVSSENIYRLPDEIPYEVGGMIESLAVAVHAVECSSTRPGDNVVILGPGPIGLGLALTCRALGVGSIVVVGISKDIRRLEIAGEIGADWAIDAETEDATSKIRKATNDFGADVVFDATGHHSTLSQAVNMIRTGGEIIVVGIPSKPAYLPLDNVVRKELRIIGAYGNLPVTWRRTMAIARKNVDSLEHIITHRISLTNAIEGFEIARSGEGSKVILIPDN